MFVLLLQFLHLRSQLLRISRIVSQAHIPIIICVSVGFIGLLRVSVQEHAVIESHPDSTKPDFRLDNPPEAFVRLVNDPENDLDSLPASQLSQVPWLIIIYKFLSHFQREVVFWQALLCFHFLISTFC